MIDELGRGIRASGCYIVDQLAPAVYERDRRQQLKALEAGFETVDLVLAAAGIEPARAYGARLAGVDDAASAVWAHAEIEAFVRIDNLLGYPATRSATLRWCPR